MTLILRWTDITPETAVAQKLDLAVSLNITAPLNEMGERCPWPWDPQQRVGAPIGQYHCPYCGAMVMAGMPHIDYAPDEQVLTRENLTSLFERCENSKLRTADVDGRLQTVGLTIVQPDGLRVPCLFGDTLIDNGDGSFCVRKQDAVEPPTVLGETL